MKHFARPCRALLVSLLALPLTSGAFFLNGQSWPNATTTFFVSIGDPWSQAFEDAMARWNAFTSFEFRIIREFRSPCNDDGLNGVAFSTTICGDAWGNSAIGITLSRFVGNTLVETDIVANSNELWSVYDGPLQGNVLDFRRMAMHELGHAMGLGHENFVDALMAPFQSDIFLPTADDIAGVSALYDAEAPCPIPVGTGPGSMLAGTLDGSECTVARLLGIPDGSFVDVYEVVIRESGTLSISLVSSQFDTFLWLFQAGSSTPLETDDDGGNGLNSFIQRSVAAGTYVIWANGFDSSQLGNYDLAIAFAPTDTDGDGLPDTLELSAGLNPNLASDAAADSDSDSFSNAVEARSGTDVFNGASFPEIDNDVVIDFGPGNGGIWTWYNDSFFQLLHPLNSEVVVTGDLDGNGVEEAVIDFGPGNGGIWVWLNNATWFRLHPISPRTMVTGDLDGNGRDDVVIDFGAGNGGIWVLMNNATFVRLHPLGARSIVTGDLNGNGLDDVVVDFGAGNGGIWIWTDNQFWRRLHPFSANTMAIGDMEGNGRDDVVIDFGPGNGGIWIWQNDSTFFNLHPLNAETIAVADLDGNGGQDDVLIDFGAANGGLWVWTNNSYFRRLHGLSPEIMITADLDSNGKIEAVVDFGPGNGGLWVWTNDAFWRLLHPISPTNMAPGELD